MATAMVVGDSGRGLAFDTTVVVWFWRQCLRIGVFIRGTDAATPVRTKACNT